MKCPKCQSEENCVTETRQTAYGTRRARMCSSWTLENRLQGCGHRWATVEIDADVFSRLIESSSLILEFVGRIGLVGDSEDAIWSFVRTICKQTERIRLWSAKRKLQIIDPEEVLA